VSTAERICRFGFVQPLDGELPKRFEDEKSPPVRLPHEALVDERLKIVETDLANLLRRFERKASGENGETRERLTIIFAQ
jgi:hypothetical protein